MSELRTCHRNRLFYIQALAALRPSAFRHFFTSFYEIPSPSSCLICASISPIGRFRQSRTPSHQPFRRSLTKNASQSVRLLASHHSGFPTSYTLLIGISLQSNRWNPICVCFSIYINERGRSLYHRLKKGEELLIFFFP